MSNCGNHKKWPSVVSRDIMTHMGGLKGDVFMFSGRVKGKTLLPLPPEADSVAQAVEDKETWVLQNYTPII